MERVRCSRLLKFLWNFMRLGVHQVSCWAKCWTLCWTFFIAKSSVRSSYLTMRTSAAGFDPAKVSRMDLDVQPGRIGRRAMSPFTVDGGRFRLSVVNASAARFPINGCESKSGRFAKCKRTVATFDFLVENGVELRDQPIGMEGASTVPRTFVTLEWHANVEVLIEPGRSRKSARQGRSSHRCMPIRRRLQSEPSTQR
jgi:hypothetical protein